MATPWDTFYKRLSLKWFRERGVVATTEKEVGHLPLTIDAVAVCTSEDVARLALDTPFDFFRRHNLMEFKSPNDPLSEAEYNRIIARALLYAAHERVSRSETLVCILVSTKPVKMIHRLAETVKFERVGDGHYVGNDAVTCHLFVASELPIEERYFRFLFLAKGQKQEAFLEAIVRHENERYLWEYLMLYPDDAVKVISMGKKLPTIEENAHRLLSIFKQEMPEAFWDLALEETPEAFWDLALEKLSTQQRQQLLKRLTEKPNGQPPKPKRSKRKRNNER
jgi:hypothetical protein